MVVIASISNSATSQNPDTVICINGNYKIHCVSAIAKQVSHIISNANQDNGNDKENKDEMPELCININVKEITKSTLNLFERYLCGDQIELNINNLEEYKCVANGLALTGDFAQKIQDLFEFKKEVDGCQYMNTVISIEKQIYDLSATSINPLLEAYNFPETISVQKMNEMVFTFCLSNIKKIDLYTLFYQKLNEKFHIYQFKQFVNFCIKNCLNCKKLSHKRSICLRYFVDNDFITFSEISKLLDSKNMIYFCDYLNINDKKILDKFDNSDELSENGWKKYKEYFLQGQNPNKIELIISHDEQNELQKMIQQRKDINFNGTISASIFDKFKKSDSESCKKFHYLDFSALYGSIKCFNLLMENGAQLTNNTLKFAIKGKNDIIISKCEEGNKCEISCMLKYSIQYHYQPMLLRIIQAQKLNESNLITVFLDCFKYHNHEALRSLLVNFIDFNKNIVFSVLYNDLQLMKMLLSIYKANIGKYINQKYNGNCALSIACYNENVEMAKLLLTQKEIDVNFLDSNNVLIY